MESGMSDPRMDCQRCWENVEVLFYFGMETPIQTERRNRIEDIPRWICGDCMDRALASGRRD